MIEMMNFLDGLTLFFVSLVLGWLIVLERRVSKLETKIDMLCKILNRRE